MTVLVPGTERYGEAIMVALEHAWWCRDQRMTPVEVLRALDPGWRLPTKPTWHHVVWALAELWHALPPAPATIGIDRQPQAGLGGVGEGQEDGTHADAAPVMAA